MGSWPGQTVYSRKIYRLQTNKVNILITDTDIRWKIWRHLRIEETEPASMNTGVSAKVPPLPTNLAGFAKYDCDDKEKDKEALERQSTKGNLLRNLLP